MEQKRTAVLILSKEFPKEHSKAGMPTNFATSLANGTKLHTIRGNYDYWAKRAKKINAGQMELSIRQWQGKPYHSHQEELARYSNIEILPISACYGSEDAKPRVWISNMEVDIEQLAANDGLSLEDWTEWFFKHSNTFEGVVIYFKQ